MDPSSQSTHGREHRQVIGEIKLIIMRGKTCLIVVEGEEGEKKIGRSSAKGGNHMNNRDEYISASPDIVLREVRG